MNYLQASLWYYGLIQIRFHKYKGQIYGNIKLLSFHPAAKKVQALSIYHYPVIQSNFQIELGHTGHHMSACCE